MPKPQPPAALAALFSVYCFTKLKAGMEMMPARLAMAIHLLGGTQGSHARAVLATPHNLLVGAQRLTR
jgi:hypothetical protein